ncbi:MAG: hypothetical protein EON58_01100 [Alphaproteobacteria bacterium]|nr:MAG: hypothetical protein EON58_01100 [Alphaproteobacteria bacterium]
MSAFADFNGLSKVVRTEGINVPAADPTLVVSGTADGGGVRSVVLLKARLSDVRVKITNHGDPEPTFASADSDDFDYMLYMGDDAKPIPAGRRLDLWAWSATGGKVNAVVGVY